MSNPEIQPALDAIGFVKDESGHALSGQPATPQQSVSGSEAENQP